MKRRSTQQGLDTTTSLKHGRRTAALMSVISALGGRRAAPPKSTELWVGQRPHTPRQCLGVSHLQEKGAQQGMPPSLPLPSNNPLPSNIPYPPSPSCLLAHLTYVSRITHLCLLWFPSCITFTSPLWLSHHSHICCHISLMPTCTSPL